MRVECAWCARAGAPSFLRTVEPLESTEVSHGICDSHYAEMIAVVQGIERHAAFLEEHVGRLDMTLEVARAIAANLETLIGNYKRSNKESAMDKDLLFLNLRGYRVIIGTRANDVERNPERVRVRVDQILPGAAPGREAWRELVTLRMDKNQARIMSSGLFAAAADEEGRSGVPAGV
jgi:hypothetical protein